MFVLSNFIFALAKIIDIALTVYWWIMVFRAVVSWVNADPYNKIVIFLYRATEPVLRPVRRIMPLRNVGIDVSPVIILVVISLLQHFLVETIIQLARNL
ncbi:MAG: YggT family protein [Smithellaceae bacterium]|jgi:YggT family protein